MCVCVCVCVRERPIMHCHTSSHPPDSQLLEPRLREEALWAKERVLSHTALERELSPGMVSQNTGPLDTTLGARELHDHHMTLT